MTSSFPRRTFLRGAAVSLSLPVLEQFLPRALAAGQAVPPRMVMICRGLGFYAPDFFPVKTGRDYELTPYLKELAEWRSDFTVISGLSHPNAGAGHAAEAGYLTGAPGAGTPTFKNSVSIDQVAAEHLGNATRFPYLALTTHGNGISTTPSGVLVPPKRDPRNVFDAFFVEGRPEELRQQQDRAARGHSILDSVRAELSTLNQSLGAADRQALDQYATAVRDVERRMHNSQSWLNKPKPRVDAEPLGEYPDLADIVGRTEMMFDLMRLALQTDSTRLITLLVSQKGGNSAPPIEGVSEGRHNLSHHGRDPAKIEQLKKIELAEMKVFAKFMKQLKETVAGGEPLLNSAMVLYGSNLGNASSHDTRNTPTILAGGRFKHGQHLAFDAEHNTPLSNLFVSMLQSFGVETDRFSSSTGTLTGLEPA